MSSLIIIIIMYSFKLRGFFECLIKHTERYEFVLLTLINLIYDIIYNGFVFKLLKQVLWIWKFREYCLCIRIETFHWIGSEENQRAEKYRRNYRAQENIDLVCATIVEEPNIYISRGPEQIGCCETTAWRIFSFKNKRHWIIYNAV